MNQLPVSPKTLLFATMGLLALAWIARPEPTPVEAGPFDPPTQIAVEEPIELPAPEGYRITALDEYSLTAMVMSRKRYRFDHQAKISPVDLLLAWGPLTREPNLSGIEYSQGGRWGNTKFRYEEINLTGREITVSTANTHMIPEYGNRAVKKRVLQARRGDTLKMRGYLVRVDGPDGWYWESSRTRRDWGAHACEIFYVTEVL